MPAKTMPKLNTATMIRLMIDKIRCLRGKWGLFYCFMCCLLTYNKADDPLRFLTRGLSVCFIYLAICSIRLYNG